MSNRLDLEQAFAAMQIFLREYQDLGPSEALEILLGGLQLMPGGGTADPALWDDWLEAVDRALKGERMVLN